MQDPAPTSCPDLETLDRFVAGALDRERRDAVLTHTTSCAECHSWLGEIEADQQLVESVRRVAAKGTPANRVPEIAGYRIEREIGRGGQGIVFLAHHDRTARPVALKVLLAGEFASTKKRARFEREVELAASLSHPNVVPIFDGGFTSEGAAYLAMERIEGRRLDHWSEAERPDVRRILAVFRGIVEGVVHAHQRGVLHRDLKPSNVLVDSADCPHLLDFGLAKRLGETDDAEDQTVSGEFVGTPAFAAPEQLAGDPRRLDVRTDVHALGSLLYFLFTGRPPFLVKGDVGATLAAIQAGRAPEASRLNPAVAKDLDVIIRHALAADPERRYQSAADLGADLDRYLAGEAVEARGPDRWYRAEKWLRRRWRTAAALGIIALALAAAAVYSDIHRRKAEAALAKRDVQAARAEEVVAIMGDALRMSSPYRSGAGATMVGFTDAWAKLLEARPPRFPESEATLRAALGATYKSLDRIAEAESQLRRALLAAERSKDTPARERLLIEIDLAEAVGVGGRYAEAKERALALVGPVEGEFGKGSPQALSVGLLIAQSELSLGRVTDAMQTALELEKSFPIDAVSVDSLRLRGMRFMLLMTLSRFDEALPFGERMLADIERVLGPDHALTVTTLGRIAEIERRLDRPKVARETAEKALRGARKAFRPTQIQVQDILVTAGVAAMQSGDAAGSLVHFRELLEAQAIDPFPDARFTAFAARMVAADLVRQKKFADAEALLVASTARLERLRPEPVDELLESATALAEPRGAAKRPREAAEGLERALASYGGKVSPQAPVLQRARFTTGFWWQEADELERAEPHYRVVLDTAPDLPEGELGFTKKAVAQALARLLDADDRPEEAAAVRAKYR